MRISIAWLIAGSAACLAMSLGTSSNEYASAAITPSVCDADDGLFVHSRVSSLTKPVEQVRQAAALGWLRSMMQPLATSGDGSSITPDQEYADGYSGQMSGTIDLATAHPTSSSSPLTVVSPSVFPDKYRGIVTGTANIQTPGTYEVRAYLMADIEYYQPAAIPAVVASDGSWSINLGPVKKSSAGEWHFRLYNKTTNVQVGDSWPRPLVYSDIQMQYYLVADVPYLQQTKPLPVNNTWEFTASDASGRKMFRIVNTTTNAVLAEYYQPATFGLIRSYEYLPGQDGYGTARAQRSYTYDQALALLVAIGAGDRNLALTLLGGLQAVQVQSGLFEGAFPARVDQLNPEAEDPEYYTGVNAFVAYALSRYVEEYGDVDSARPMLEANLAYLDTMRSDTGAGSGLYRGGARVRNGVTTQISWYSTEHNTDLWHTFERAGRVLARDDLRREAARLAPVVVQKLWNQPQNRFDQGLGDDAKALDTASWGSTFLSAIGEYDKAEAALAATDEYARTVGSVGGYTPYILPGSVPTVWHEGTYGVALAHMIAGNTARLQGIFDQSAPGQKPNGAFAYAEIADPANELTDANSVASTAWYYLTANSPRMMWSECMPQRLAPGGDNVDEPDADGSMPDKDAELGVPNTGADTKRLVTSMHRYVAVAMIALGIGSAVCVRRSAKLRKDRD